MLRRNQLHNYQRKAIQHILDHPQAMMWMDIGMGKSITTLTAIADLFDQGMTAGVLVVAPLRVIQSVWEHEAQKWEHTCHLTFTTLRGTDPDKKRNLNQVRHIYLINYESLPWLADAIKSERLMKGKLPRFDTVIFDEVTRLKSTRDPARDEKGGMRGEAMLSIMNWIPRRVGLTGTPAPNGLIDLFGQYLMVDAGQRLGRSEEAYKSRFFSGEGFGNYKSKPTSLGTQQINDRIGSITLQMKGEDYLELPALIEDIVTVEFTPGQRQKYDMLELEMFTNLDSGANILAVNSLALMNKCLQFCNGAIYLVSGESEWEQIHNLKLDALEEIYDSHGQQPLLVAYHYKHDRDRIVQRFQSRGRVVVLDSSVKGEKVAEIIAEWNRGEIPFLVGHPASIGHGLNLQFGSNHVVMFGLDYNLEYMQQFMGRLARQGQPSDRVFVHKILVNDTMDDVVLDALAGKENTQNTLRHSVQDYRKKRGLL